MASAQDLSKTEIINAALLKIGQAAIMSGTDQSIMAKRAVQEFAPALETVLRAYPWPFAMARHELPRLVEAPKFEYKYYYELPSDLIRVMEVFNGKLPYDLESNKLATDAEKVYVKYVSTSEALLRMDASTRDVVALNLAARLSLVTTENLQVHQRMLEQYEHELSLARGYWAFESMPTVVEEGDWLPSRSRGAGKSHFTANPWGPDGIGISGGEPRGPGVFKF